MEKSAGIQLELKDLDSKSGTGVIKHSVYNSVDLAQDIATKGMFDKTWVESKARNIRQRIGLLFNHETKDKVGYVTDVYDDNSAAYTEFKLFGSQITRISEYADNDILTGASFGYQTIKKEFTTTAKGQKVRKLLEVKHLETSLLDVQPCHPEAGLLLLKSLDGIGEDEITELLTWGNEHITSLKSYVQKIESYCRKSKATDETIIGLQNGLIEYKKIITDYDTALTCLIDKPDASDEVVKQITNYLTSFNLRQWTSKNN